MNLKKEKIFVIFVFFIILFFGIKKEINFLSKNYYSINFFNIELWDAILIKTPQNKKIIIDWWNWDELISKLSKKMWFFEKKIDLIIISHSDWDHIWGLIELISKYKIWEIWLWNSSKLSSKFQEFLKIIKEKNISYKFVNENSDIFFDKNLFIDILYPFENSKTMEKNNNNSISFRIEIWKEKKSILFTWDNEKEVEEILLQKVWNLKSDILKAGHHGSKTSSSTWFLKIVNPNLIIFTAKLWNKFNHPHKEIVKRCEILWIKTRQTWIENGVELKFY